VKAHPFGLGVAQLAGLVPDRVRHTQTPEIMNQPGPADQRHVLAAEPEDPRSLPGQVGHGP
jgi:hypothetical protein